MLSTYNSTKDLLSNHDLIVVHYSWIHVSQSLLSDIFEILNEYSIQAVSGFLENSHQDANKTYFYHNHLNISIITIYIIVSV